MNAKIKEHLCKNWIHSFEEDTETEKVYRTEDYDFPMSRQPREHILITSDGKITLADTFESDKPEGKSNRWDSEDERILKIYDEKNEPVNQLEILALGKGLLKLKK
jgi:hypothetical protein